MKYLLPWVLAALLCAACLVPASASAYYYRGHHYRYRYHGHYYRYSYHNHYYRHRAWVATVNGRLGTTATIESSAETNGNGSLEFRLFPRVSFI